MLLPVSSTTSGRTQILFLLAFTLAAFAVQAQDLSGLEDSWTPRLLPKSVESKSKSAAASTKTSKRTLKDTADTGEDSDSDELETEADNLKKCPSLNLFNTELTLEEKTGFADLKPCPKSTNDCCTPNQLLQIAKWWQGPMTTSTQTSRASLRKQQIDAIGYFTTHFLQKAPTLLNLSKKIQKSTQAHTTCLSAATKFSSLSLQGDQEQIKFDKEFKLCTDFNSNLIASILCNVCDSSMSSVISLDQNTIFINENSCKKITENCAEMGTMNAAVLRPFFVEMEILTRCSTDGQLSDVDLPLAMGLEGGLTEIGEYERAEGESVDGVTCGK
jgi:hypothetical protein